MGTSFLAGRFKIVPGIDAVGRDSQKRVYSRSKLKSTLPVGPITMLRDLHLRELLIHRISLIGVNTRPPQHENDIGVLLNGP